MSDTVHCDACNKVGKRQKGKLTAEGWFYLEASADGDTTVTYACSVQCALKQWKIGPGRLNLQEPVWAARGDRLRGLPPTARAESEEPMIDPSEYADRLNAIGGRLTIGRLTAEDGCQSVLARLYVRENGVTRMYEAAYDATPEGEQQMRQDLDSELGRHG